MLRVTFPAVKGMMVHKVRHGCVNMNMTRFHPLLRVRLIFKIYILFELASLISLKIDTDQFARHSLASFRVNGAHT